MPAVDRNQLLNDVVKYIGPSNILDDATILELVEEVILEVGDDQLNYKEIRCKSLLAVAKVNQVMATVDGSGGIKKEQSKDRMVEFHSAYDNATNWENYIDNLPQLCEVLGYCGLGASKAVGIYINSGTPVNYPSCTTYCNYEGYEYE